MNKYIVLSLVFIMALSFKAEAGNPDRQGEAGAYELLLNPWARSSGLKGLNTSSITGIESMRFNAAGLSAINKTQVVLSRTNYLGGSGVSFSSGGLAQRISDKGVIGLSLMSVNFGEIDVTTTEAPEGTGATYKPVFFNIGVGYSHKFSDRISTGITFRVISENGQNVSAFGAAIDAGIQYNVSNFHIGISLRNIGLAMKFNGGDGRDFVGSSPPSNSNPTGGNSPYTVTLSPNPFEVPTVLNLGLGYDFKFAEDNHRVSPSANYTSNSFSKDQYGLGVEYAMKEMFMLRVAYQYENGALNDAERSTVNTGLAAGVSVQLPVKKGSDTKVGIDYAYQTTNPFNGTHTIGLRFDL